nr:preprotein translocase subunit SecE [Ruania alba]
MRADDAGKGRRTASRSEAEAARAAQPNAFARIWRFIRQVIAELRKVVTPTRTELLTYVAVVIVFLIVMMAYVGVLDYGFGRLVLWAFGG